MAKTDATKVIEAFITTVRDTLTQDQVITLMGFGTFKTAHRSARIGRNPQTKAALPIPARRIPKFIPGKGLRDAIIATPTHKKKG